MHENLWLLHCTAVVLQNQTSKVFTIFISKFYSFAYFLAVSRWEGVGGDQGAEVGGLETNTQKAPRAIFTIFQ